MMPNSGARRCTRENVGGAAISTSHLVKLGSARMRTCERRHQDPCSMAKKPDSLGFSRRNTSTVKDMPLTEKVHTKTPLSSPLFQDSHESFAREAVIFSKL